MNSKTNWEAFMKMLSPAPGERVLDVGAGKGKVARRVLAESGGAAVFTLEPNEKRVSSMRKETPQLKCYVGGSEKMPFENSFFDKAYVTMAAHHFSDMDLALLEFARVLKEGGRLVILDIDPNRGAGRVAQFFENTVMRRHTRFLRADQMKKRVLATGRFEVPVSDVGTFYLILCVAKATKA